MMKAQIPMTEPEERAESAELAQLRSRINEIDDQLVDLFTARMDAALAIGRYKQAHNLPVLDAGRQKKVLSRAVNRAGVSFAEEIQLFFSCLFDISRSRQRELLIRDRTMEQEIHRAMEHTPRQFPASAVIACQGVEGSYGQIACDKLFSMAEIMYFQRFEGVFQAVEQGLCRYGILPVENSTAGSVTEVYDLMKQYRFHIVRSIRLRVSHSLLTKGKKPLSQIREIVSHEQAVSQCGAFLRGLKNVKVTLCENTAAAAKLVAESDRDDLAAISSRNCGALYGLDTLAEDIQDNDNNFTRFICISKALEIYPGAGKISVMTSLDHQPGALYELIGRFAVLGLNLTKLESRPISGRDFEFMFYFDFDASVYNDKVIRLLEDLSESSDRFVFLGSYSEAL